MRIMTKMMDYQQRWSYFCKPENDALRRLPFCFPIPSFERTSRTSPAAEGPCRFLGRDLDRVWASRRLFSPLRMEEVWSRVDIEGGRAKAGFDMLLLPSKASRRSVTPRPRVERDKLWSDMLFICIRAGEILRSGETPSPPTVASKPDSRSTRTSVNN
jgi:hypothetical protein